MKIQPEFNIAAILSKISVADVASNQLSAAQRATSPFESYFEAALQEIDDPQLAATIATLNESGMIQPDSSGAFSAPDAGSGLLMAAGPEALPLSFRTLQLLNGRSVITTSVAFSDTAIRSPAMSEGLLAENPAFKQQSALIRAQIRALLGDTAIVPKESEVAAASVSPAIPASITASRPVPSQKVTAASVMPRGLITVPSVQTPAQEAARLQLFAPTQSVPPQTAVPSQLTASAETAERRSSTEAWLSASVRASSPVPLQTVTAASVMPQGQTTVPSVQTPTQEAARPQLFAPTQAVPSQTAVPAQLTAPAETGERRPSTEAWLSASVRASSPVPSQKVTAASVMPQGQTTVPSVQTPAQEAARPQLFAPTQSVPSQTAVPAQLTASAETGERRPSTEAWLSASVRASSPVPSQKVTAASVMPQGLTTVPSVQTPTQEAAQSQLTASAETGERRPSTEAWLSASGRASRPVTLQTVAAGLGSVMPQGQTTVPSVQAPTQEAAQSQLTASAETGERRPSTEAWLSASVRASSPVPLQTVTAASVQPQGQTTVPSVLAPTQSVPSQTAVPAQLAASAETGERLPSTEAWLSSSTRANVEAPALVSTSAPRTSASGMSIIGASQTVSDISTRSRPGARESSAQRFSSSDLPKVAGMAVLADAALAKSDQPALLAMEIPGSASLPAALISESAVQPTSTNQVSVSVPGQPTAQPSADSQRTAERWMHVDDLGKQFGSVIQGALLNRTVAGQTSLRIMLYPENMGGIEAEIIDNNQGVTVNLIAQNDDVVRLLKDHSQALRDLLAQSGSFELNIMKERSGSDAHQARDQSGSGNDRSQPLLESLPKPGNGVVPGSLRPNESGELDTYV